MSKRKTSASSQVPNTEKKMKVQGRRQSALICFEVFATNDEVQSLHVFSKETIRNYAVINVSKSINNKLCSATFCPSPKEHVYMQVSALGWKTCLTSDGITWGQFKKTFTSVAFVIKLQNNGHNCKLHL